MIVRRKFSVFGRDLLLLMILLKEISVKLFLVLPAS